MPFATKKINMVIHTNSAVRQQSNNFSNNNSSFTTRSVRNVFNNQMIGRIQNIKPGCGSCGVAK